MIYDKDIEKTNRVINGFGLNEQKILRRIIKDIVFLKNTYSSIKNQVVLMNLILIGIDKSSSKKDFSWLLPIIQSLNTSVSIDIVKLLQANNRSDDITIYKTLNNIKSNSKIFLNFLNQKYEYNMSMNRFKVLLIELDKEVDSLEKINASSLNEYRNKQIAHLTRKTLGDAEMKNMIFQQKQIYLKYTVIFKTALGIGVKLPVVSEPMISSSNEILINNCMIFLKKVGLYRHIKRDLTEELYASLGIQENRHYTIVTENGIISS